MTKTEISAAIAGRHGLTKATAGRIYDQILESFGETLKNEGRVVLPGIGSFDVVERAGREGRNPRTGEKLQIAAKKAVRFHAAKQIKDMIQ